MMQIGQTNHERRYWANKLRDNKLALVPLLQVRAMTGLLITDLVGRQLKEVAFVYEGVEE